MRSNPLTPRLAALLILGCVQAVILPAASADPLAQPLSRADARHLYSRTGFGVTLEQLLAAEGLTRRQAVAGVLAGLATDPHVAMPNWVDAPAPQYWTRSDMERDEQRRFDRQRDRELADLRSWWVNNLLQTNSPQTERLVLFWHDHFATSYHDIQRQSLAMARQNQTFRELGWGSYRSLLKAMIRDPALLNYLDNTSNRKQAPNENLARELLELFTLGEGNYTEHTVKEAARALTGYNVNQTHNLSFRFHIWQHDEGNKLLFGQSGPHTGDSLIDIILEQPAASRFLVNRFWHAFVSDKPPTTEQLELLASEFAASDFDLKTLYEAVLSSDAFWSDEHRGSLVKSPADLLIGTARSLEYPMAQWQRIPALLAQAGLDLFAPPNVAGWEEGIAYVAPGRLLNRYDTVDALLATTDGVRSSMMTADELATGNMSMADNAAMMTGQGNMMMSSMAATSALQVRLAAEHYQGAAEYRIDLRTGDELTWTSGPIAFDNGHDTERYGRIDDASSLAWQSVPFSPDEAALERATHVDVHFLNDAAGETGDRNLYVDGVQLGDQWLDSIYGNQHSDCKPGNVADAGNLYCAGYVSLALPAVSRSIATQDDDVAGAAHNYTASRATARWITHDRGKHGRQNLDITLEDLHTPGRVYDTFTVQLLNWARHERPLEMRIESYDCWPDCLNHWPECAWQSDTDIRSRTLAFPMVDAGSDNQRCHYESLTADDQALISVLWRSIPALVSHVAPSRRSQREAVAIEAWKKTVSNEQHWTSRSRYAAQLPHVDARIQIDPGVKIHMPPPSPVTPPLASHRTLGALQASLSRHQLSLSDLLLPGVPGITNVEPALTTEEQLRQLLDSALYQVR